MSNLEENYSNKYLFIRVILIYISFILLETIVLHFSEVLDLLGLYSMNITGIYYDNYMDVILYNFILVNLFTALSFYMKAKYRLPFNTKSRPLGLIFAILIIAIILLMSVITVIIELSNPSGLFSLPATQYNIFQYIFYVSASMLNMYMLSFVLIPAGIRSVIKNRAISITMEILASCFAFSLIEVLDWMDFSYLLDQATLVLPVALVLALSRKHYLSLPLFLFMNVGYGLFTSGSYNMKYFLWFLIIYPINIALIIFFNLKNKHKRNVI